MSDGGQRRSGQRLGEFLGCGQDSLSRVGVHSAGTVQPADDVLGDDAVTGRGAAAGRGADAGGDAASGAAAGTASGTAATRAAGRK